MKMKTPIFWLAPLFFVALGGCQYQLDVMVINHLSEAVFVRIGEETRVIPSNGIAKLHYPDANGVDNGIIYITLSKCTLAYHPPMDFDSATWIYKNGSPIAVQLDVDYKMYYIPKDTVSAVPLESLSDKQRSPFPLLPVSRTCE